MSYTTDASIGNNLERLRGDMSMDMLAAKMRERGYSWTKTTVFNIEHGKRPLRLSEAADVLVCLKVEPSSYVFELLRSEKEHLWIGKVGLVSYAEDQVETACENYVNQINYLLDFLDSDIAKATSSEAEKRVDHYREYTATQLKVARSLAPYVEGILDFFEQSGDKLPLVFVDGGFKRLEYEDFNKDVEIQLESIGITSEEINSLKERAKKIRDSSLTSK
ncbi:hypothetical protein [Bifidobacterium mongoliense]|nr:hypothetical protein [Bifidobacterium mongoliense]